MKNASNAEFRAKVESGDKVIVLFGMAGCAPCKIMKARLNDRDYGVPVFYLDAQRDQQPFTDYGVRNVPTLLVFNHGKMQGRMVGPNTGRAIDDFIDEAFEEEE